MSYARVMAPLRPPHFTRTIEGVSSAGAIYAPGTPQVPCSAGIAITDGVRELADLVGQEVVDQALATLALDQRAELESATALSWIRVSTSAALFDAAARLAKHEPEPMVDEITRRATKRTFTTAWRMLVRLTTDEAMIKRAPTMYARGRNTGRLTAGMREPGLAALELTGWPGAPKRQIRVFGISMQTIALLSGRRDVAIQIEHTREGAQYELRWATE
jgi:hypothetical protein